MNLDTEAIKIIAKEFVKVMNENNSSLPFDYTVNGKIIKKTDNGYLVSVEGKRINIKTDVSSILKPNDTVRICYPHGNVSEAYIVVDINLLNKILSKA